ncbi:hypothetical protein MRX96_046825 [Rhipicephalus microplus]
MDDGTHCSPRASIDALGPPQALNPIGASVLRLDGGDLLEDWKRDPKHTEVDKGIAYRKTSLAYCVRTYTDPLGEPTTADKPATLTDATGDHRERVRVAKMVFGWNSSALSF